MSSFTNPGTTDFAFPTGNGNSVLIPVQEDALSLSAGAKIAAKLHTELAAGTITPYTYDGTSAFNPPAGNTELIVDAAATLTLTSNISEVLVNTTRFVSLGAGPNTAQQDVIAGTGGISLVANDGTGTILAAGGDNTIQVLVGGNHDIVTGAGNDVIRVTHGDNLIEAGAGKNTLTLGDGNNDVVSTGQDFIVATANLTTSGTDTIDASLNTNAVLIRAGHNNIVFLNGSGVSQFQGQFGSDTVYGGAGGGTFTGGSAGDNLLIAGTGAATLVGGGSGDVLAVLGGNASNVLTAASGNETLIGGLSTGANTFHAGSGADLVVGGLGNDTLQAGTGSASISGSLGSNEFLFVDGQAGGQDTLLDFTLSHGNKVALQGYGANEVQNALAGAVVAHGSTTITLSDNTVVTFLNDAHVTASNFA
jgi:Ca2+-binding RTX toxin-like protein